MGDAHGDYSRLAEVVSGIGLHEHLCIIYDTQEEQFAAALPYLRTGLERGEKCLYIVDENTAAAVLDALGKGGTDVDRYLRSGALTIAGKEETYLEKGRFEPDWMIGFLTEATAESGAARLSKVRTILAEMTWALGTSNGTAKLIEYESKLNHFFRDHDARGICQYNRTHFSPELLLGVIRTHPLVVYGGMVCRNPYYVPPDEFLKPSEASREVERLLHNILEWEREITERKRAEDDLRRQKEMLQKIFDNAPAMIALRGPDGKMTFANREFERTLGWTLEDVFGHDLDLLTAAYPDPRFRQEVTKLMSSSETEFAEVRLRARDGRVIETSWGKVHLSDGADIYIGRDITERKQTEDRLREYEKVVEGLEEMIVVVDSRYRYLIANRAFLSYMGLEREQLIGRFVQDMTTPGVFENLVKAKLDECFRGNVVKYELKYLYPARGERDLSVSYFPIESAGAIDRVACVLQDVTERKQAEAELRSLTGRILSLEDEERRRLARELHDTTSQSLAALCMNLSVVSESAGVLSPRAQAAIAESAALADQCLREIRTVSYLLHPPELDEPGLLQYALSRYIDGFIQRSGIRVEIEVPPDLGRLPRLIETTVFRIVQESLTNIHRHSGSDTARVRLAKNPSNLVLEIEDAGEGIRADAPSGVGIASMRERLQQVNGRLETISRPGGTVIRATIPLPAGI